MNFPNCSDEGFRLIDNGNNSSAQAIWNEIPLDLTVGFTANFSIRFSNINGTGADGTCFVLQNESIWVVGGDGGDLGYAGPSSAQSISPSVVVEFDIFDNGLGRADIPDDHTVVVYGGVMSTPESGPISLGEIEDSTWHAVQVIWDPCTPVFKVNFDGNNVITLYDDIVANAFSGNPNNVFWGFTAADASGQANHDLCVAPIQIHPSNPLYDQTDLTACAEEDNFGYIALNANAEFEWTFPSGSTASKWTSGSKSIILNASEGLYQVVLTYPNGCTETLEYLIVEDCCDDEVCPSPEDLHCLVKVDGQTVLKWTPVPGACGYIVNFNPDDSQCFCNPTYTGLSIFTTISELPIPPEAGNCFSWNVQTQCCDESLSLPSQNTCFSGNLNCLYEVELPPYGLGTNHNVEEINGLSIYPNPSQGEVTIEFDLAEGADISISIYDNVGKMIGSFSDTYANAGSYKKNWRFDELTLNGIYFVKINYGNGDMEVQKVVIQK